ncbi:MAG: sodium:solute symporter [Bacteroidota bacterium]
MSILDWIVLLATTFLIVGYGIWKSRGATNIRGYLLADKEMKWWTIGLSIMATQASAITFLSTPGQAFDDGMRFVQFYFGVPIAMVIISMVAIPIYHRLNVYTAYEYLESRFDVKVRSFTAFLFLVSRGLAAGLTIYAPAIILSTILEWDIGMTIRGIGVLVVFYTVLGGAKAVNYTQKQQMIVILIGMFLAGIWMVLKLPDDISFGSAVAVAGKMGKLNAITLGTEGGGFDLKDRYNLFSGLIGGTFLALSYFGTDQSQVQRYLGGKSLSESRIGLLFSGVIKVPMQFLILFIGVLMFMFYQFEKGPIFFNQSINQEMRVSELGESYTALEDEYSQLHTEKQQTIRQLITSMDSGDEAQTTSLTADLKLQQQQERDLRESAKSLITQHDPDADTNDKDKVFLTFVVTKLPQGLVGLLIAVILAASMSSTAAELNALGTTTLIDGYKRFSKTEKSDKHFLNVSRGLTFFWGILAILFALFANKLGNMIQAVNIIGSLFYGTILGIFVVAFFFKQITGTAVFIGAILAEICVIALFVLPQQYPSLAWLDIGFLWYNLIGCAIVVLLAFVFQKVLPQSGSISPSV